MKNILVATDLSARSDRAVLRAVKLAKHFNSRLVVVSVIDNQIPRGIIEENEKLVLKEIKSCLRGKTKNLEYDIKICVGNPHTEIIKTAYEEKVDLIVAGIHRHINKDQPIVGSVIERLLHFSNKPLLIVRDRSENNYKKAIVALDFNNDSKKSLSKSFEIFNNCKFYLLHSYMIPFVGFMGKGSKTLEQQIIDESVQEIEEIVNNILKELKNITTPETEKIVRKGPILGVLEEETKHIRPNLLVLGIHGRSAFSRSLMSSASQNTLKNPPCDVFLTGNN